MELRGGVSSRHPAEAHETRNNSLESRPTNKSTKATGRQVAIPKRPKRPPVPSPAMPRNPFIVATSLDNIKPDKKSRRFIRSHAMTGRKRRSAASHRPAPGSWINGRHEADQLRPAGAAVIVQKNKLRLGLCPQITSLELDVVEFAVDVQPNMMHLIYEFFTRMKEFIHPIERCVDLGDDSKLWFEDLGKDPAYVHALVFMSQAYFDILDHQQCGATAMVHMIKTISHLQERLTSAEFVPTNATLFVVMSLATAANEFGDFEAAGNHLHGLYRMVMLRGGLQALAEQRSLQLKLCRLDLTYALKTGTQPLFFADGNISWAPYIVDPDMAAVATTPIQTLCDNPDLRLSNVWLDLREFAQAINLVVQMKTKVDSELFQETLISGQYRLLQLNYDSADFHELLRLGALAFTTTIFLEIYGIGQNYGHLGEKLRRLLRQSLDRPGTEARLGLNLWLIIVSSLSVLNGADDKSWLHAQLHFTTQAMGLASWSEVRDVLKSHMWIEIVNDEAGKLFFDEGA